MHGRRALILRRSKESTVENDHVVPGKSIPDRSFFSPGFRGKGFTAFSRGILAVEHFLGGPALCQSEFIPRSDGPRQRRSVYTVKPEACNRIAGYIRCYEVGRSRVLHLGRRDAIYTSSGRKVLSSFRGALKRRAGIRANRRVARR